MKSSIKILIFSFFAITSYAQQATEIDSKSVKLPRYADQAAVTAAIPTPNQGMLIFRLDTKSNWYFDGTVWKDINSTPYPLIVTGTTLGTSGNISIKGESIVTYPPIYSGPDLFGGIGVQGISNGGIYGIGVQGQGYGPFHVGVKGYSDFIGVQGTSNLGIGVYGKSYDGTSGKFEIDNFANSSIALHAITNGTGRAAYFQGTNALETNGTIKFGGSGVGTPTAGKVLTAIDNLGNATWQAIPAVVAPLSLNLSAIGGTTITGVHTNAGAVGAIGGNGVRGDSNGGEQGAGVLGVGTTGNYGVWGYNSSFIGIYGSGETGGVFTGTTTALRTSGALYFGGSGVGTPSAGKVLTATDNLGNATWQAIPTISAPLNLNSTATTLTSTSTVGIAASFSSTSGYALVTGTGNVGIGTPTPTAKLEVAGFTKLGDDATAPKIKMKELSTFNTASGASAGSGLSLPIAHGLSASKIISISVLVTVGTETLIPPVYTSDSRLNYNYFISGANFYIQNSSTDCTNPGDHICGKPVKVLITYKE